MSQPRDPDTGLSTPSLPQTLDANEVIRRFPEVRWISDDLLRARTIDALRYTPEYFWDVPASTSGKYHNPFARGTHGLWIHTKMAIAVYEEIVESHVQMGDITEQEADFGRAAVLLHDQFKQGYPSDRSENPKAQHTVGDHDVLAAEWFREHTDLPDPVVEAVESHNGPWSKGKDPETELERLVHLADLIASRATVTVDVVDPAEELVTAYPDLPTQS